jgi:hypothetical protein
MGSRRKVGDQALMMWRRGAYQLRCTLLSRWFCIVIEDDRGLPALQLQGSLQASSIAVSKRASLHMAAALAVTASAAARP